MAEALAMYVCWCVLCTVAEITSALLIPIGECKKGSVVLKAL